MATAALVTSRLGGVSDGATGVAPPRVANLADRQLQELRMVQSHEHREGRLVARPEPAHQVGVVILHREEARWSPISNRGARGINV
jgi:hypothetical protein